MSGLVPGKIVDRGCVKSEGKPGSRLHTISHVFYNLQFLVPRQICFLCDIEWFSTLEREQYDGKGRDQ
jgi:hypothetical protein